MAQVIPATGLVISVEYPGDDGARWARLYDNAVKALIVDETGAVPSIPVIIGKFPVPATDTAPILSPQWAGFDDPAVVVPDLWRGTLPAFFTWLATNNGANRPLQARFGVSPALLNGFHAWARDNPGLVFEGDEPPVP